MSWSPRRLDWLVTEERRTVDPSKLAAETVFHYSIPAFDLLGNGQLESADHIGSGKLLLSGGEVLISKLNPRKPRILRADAHNVPTLASTEFIALRPGADVDERFLRYWLGAEFLRQELDAATMSVTRSQQRIRPDVLTQRRVSFPPRATQRGIADYLDVETARIDALVTRKKLLSAKLGERWRSNLVVGLRLPSEPQDGEEAWVAATLPPGWSRHRLRRLLAGTWGGDWGAEPGQRLRDLSCVRAADFDFAQLQAVSGVERSFDQPTLAGRLLSSSDLVIEKSGGGEDVPVGRVVVWNGEGQGVPTNFAAGMRPAEDADSDFVLLVFRAAYEIGLPWRSIKQTTGLQNLDLGHYLSHVWPVPPLDEQRELAAALLRSLEQVRMIQARLDDQVRLLREHRQALVTAAVTGELDIPGAA